MAHECLKRARIDSSCRQGVTSSMPQDVSVHRKWQLSGLAKPLFQLLSEMNLLPAKIHQLANPQCTDRENSEWICALAEGGALA
jgi:hypothetical protein